MIARNFWMSLFLYLLLHSSSSAAGDLIRFICIWGEGRPIEILVDARRKTATRSDGGLSYDIIKVTNYAVWLAVAEPKNQMDLKWQMIQRRRASNGKAGLWQDIVQSVKGDISPINGGKCWESG
jgi:hypothetical protein